MIIHPMYFIRIDSVTLFLSHHLPLSSYLFGQSISKILNVPREKNHVKVNYRTEMNCINEKESRLLINQLYIISNIISLKTHKQAKKKI